MNQTLLIGDYRHREFGEAVGWLARNTWLALAVDVPDALARITRQQLYPELIVIAQSRPGQFARAGVDRLHAAAPLARLVALLGSWCEGEPRSGKPWPGVLRVYWHEFALRARRGLIDGPPGGGQAWELPRTRTEAELVLADARRPAAAEPQRLIVIRAADLPAYEALAVALNREGFATTWVGPRRRAFASGQLAGIWDSATLAADDAPALRQFAQQLHPAPVIALANFPRLAECRLLQAAGAAAVLGKPTRLSHLLMLLEQPGIETPALPARSAFAA